MFINKVYLSGRIVYGPTLKILPSGVDASELGLLVESRHTNKIETSLFKIISFGKLAKAMDDLLIEGDKIIVEGRLRQESWTYAADPTQKRQAVKVVAETFHKIDTNVPADKSFEFNGSKIIMEF